MICNAQTDGGLRSAITRINDRVRARAYELFDDRGQEDGHALDDWLTAESELISHPRIGLVETNEELCLTVDATGFKGADLHIEVLPTSMIIVGEHTNHAKHHREEEGRALVAQVDLPCPIDENDVEAKVRHHILEIIVKKAQQSAESAAWVSQ
jgi:HSP20 family molecular chaperone IbpA